MPQLRTGKLNKKVCMLGTFAVGKTSLVRQFVHSIFSEDYLSTVGVQLSTKSLKITDPEQDKTHEVTLILWDLAQLEKVDNVVKNYLHGSHAAIVVFDLTRPQTFAEADEMIQNYKDINPDSQLVLAGNKTDIAEDEEARKKLRVMAESLNCDIFFTSARTGENVDLMFKKLAQQLI